MTEQLSGLRFTFADIAEQYSRALDCGYTFLTCADYVARKAAGAVPELTIVNRVDIDVSVRRAGQLGEIFARLGISATFFIRLHGDYNPFSFENYRIIRGLARSGFELGYHSEIVDQSAIWGEDPAECLRRDLALFGTGFSVPTLGVASHGGVTGLNNLDFWSSNAPADFGLLYEAYDRQPEFNLFAESVYVSDSEWTRWKCYNRGVLAPEDRRSLAQHAEAGHCLIYLLVHSDTYYDRHPYE